VSTLPDSWALGDKARVHKAMVPSILGCELVGFSSKECSFIRRIGSYCIPRRIFILSKTGIQKADSRLFVAPIPPCMFHEAESVYIFRISLDVSKVHVTSALQGALVMCSSFNIF